MEESSDYENFMKFKNSAKTAKVVRKPDILLKYECDLEEAKIKNTILDSKLMDYMNKNFDLELKLQFLEAKIDEFMKKDEKNRIVSTSKIIGG